MNHLNKYFFIACAILLTVYSHAQNVVPNPSFEDTIHCPTTTNQLSDAQFWVNPTTATPDYFNTCSTSNADVVHIPNNGYGTQSAHTGNAYAGFYAFNKPFPNMYREYIQANLAGSLLANHKYLVSFYLSLAEGSQYADNNIGVYFSNLQISSSSSNALTTYTPQIQSKSTQHLSDKVNWMLISDTLTAQGGEQYITIGNFVMDNLSDTLFLGNSGGSNMAYYYIDDVSVIDINTIGLKQEIISNNQLSVYPNPTNSSITIQSTNELGTVRIYNILSQLVFNTKAQEKSLQIDLSEQDAGVYYVQVHGSTLKVIKQ